MEIKNKRTKLKKTLNYINLLIVLVLFSFIQLNSAKAQTSIQSNTEELDWTANGIDTEKLTEEEKKLAQQTALAWEKWDAENPSTSTTQNTDKNKEETTKENIQNNEIKSPSQILMDALIGNWEGFYGGSKAYINFKENKTVVINTSVFSNIPSASGREATQLYYEIDASKSPYRLIFYNRDREIKGVFRIQDNNQITICHNFKNEEQPQEINNKYTMFTLYKIEEVN